MRMIERVARAMDPADWAWFDLKPRSARAETSKAASLARAERAIRAMWEPTDAMHNGARDWSSCHYGRPIGIDASLGCWRAMIDAALAEEEAA